MAKVIELFAGRRVGQVLGQTADETNDVFIQPNRLHHFENSANILFEYGDSHILLILQDGAIFPANVGQRVRLLLEMEDDAEPKNSPAINHSSSSA